MAQATVNNGLFMMRSDFLAIQVRAELVTAVQELEGLLQNGEPSAKDLAPSVDDNMNGAPSHAGLGFRYGERLLEMHAQFAV